MKNNKKDTWLGVRIPKHVMLSLKTKAAKQDRSVSYLVLKYVLKGLKE
jgi:hypothetical protein